VGFSWQAPLTAAQTVLSLADVSSGMSAIIFAQTIGGTIFVSVAQTVFANKLLSSLHAHVPGLDPLVVIGNGASGLRSAVGKVGERFVPDVLLAYNEAISDVFVVALVMSCLSILGAMAMEWRSVKEKEWQKGKKGV
jgi:hypothetical protein